MMHNRARQLHDAVAARNPIFNVKLCGACQGHGFLSTCLQDRGSCDKLTSRPRLTALAESTHGPCLLIHWRICEPEILSKLNLHIQNSAMVRVFMDAPKVRCGCTCAHACMHACMAREVGASQFGFTYDRNHYMFISFLHIPNLQPETPNPYTLPNF